jgi:hypothetical protein
MRITAIQTNSISGIIGPSAGMVNVMFIMDPSLLSFKEDCKNVKVYQCPRNGELAKELCLSVQGVFHRQEGTME